MILNPVTPIKKMVNRAAIPRAKFNRRRRINRRDSEGAATTKAGIAVLIHSFSDCPAEIPTAT